jgi:subtilisin
MRSRAVGIVAVLTLAATGCAAVQRASIGATPDPDGASMQPALSADGRVLAFTSLADDLVAGDANDVADIFVRDGTATSRISIATNGGDANGPSSHPSLSADGRYVAFQSDATNLVVGDTNNTTDVFVRDRVAGTTTVVSQPGPGPASAAGTAGAPAVTPPTAAPGDPRPLGSRDAGLAARAEIAPLRVIVQTATDFAPEGRMGTARWVSQRQAIARDQDAVVAAIRGHGRELHRTRTLPIVVAEVDATALARLRADPAVARVTADDPVPAALVNSGPVVGLPASHDAGFTGRGKAVAILDTGVDRTHPFFGGRVVEEACYSASGDCPNGGSTQTGPGSAVPCTYAPTGCRHGTHVAGIAAGSAVDADGVAPNASIISVQVFSEFTGTLCTRGEDPCPLTLPSDWILALERIYELRTTYDIAAVNMSIGGFTSTTDCDDDAIKPAVDQLRAVGIPTVISAGNEGQADAIGFPACISSSIGVGATTNADVPASFSNSSTLVELFAPGSGVRSSVPGGSFANFSGTSMAAPHVTGAFALAKERDPDLTVDAALAAFQATGRRFTDARNGFEFSRLCTSGALGLDRCPNVGGSRRPSISADGHQVAFESDAPLVAADTNGVTDVYLRDVPVATTTRVSVATGGAQAAGPSTHPSISADGNRIAFDSTAADLVLADSNGAADVFLRDRAAAATTRVSVVAGGAQAVGPSREAAISGDGNTIVFTSAATLTPNDDNGVADVYAYDVHFSETELVSATTRPSHPADGPSGDPSVTGDGRFVVFTSDATNLDADPNGETDAYVRDLAGKLTQRASADFWSGPLGAAAVHAVAASGGGVMAFATAADDAVDEPDTNAAFDVFRRAIVRPVVGSANFTTMAPGTTWPFTITGSGFRAPMQITVRDATVTIAGLSDAGIVGTITVAPDASSGPRDLVVTNLTDVPGLFGGTICAGCVTVGP